LQYWLKGGGSAMSQDTRLVDVDPVATAVFCKFITETAFPNTRLADDTNDTTIPLQRVLKLSQKGRELLVSTDEGAQSLSASKYATRRRMEQALYPVYLNRLCNSAHRLWA